MPRVAIKDLDSTEKGPGSDMGLYFNHTYIRVSKDGGEPQWAEYLGFKGDGEHSFKLGKGDIFTIPAGHPKAFVEWMFPTGWFNTKKSAIFCERIPKRQFLKGIHNGSNFSVTTAEAIAKMCGMLVHPTQQEVIDSIMQEGKVVFSLSLVKDVFENPGFPSLEEAYVSLKGKKAFCRALSSDLALIPHPQTKDFIVLCHDVVVAEMITKNKVHMLIPEFKPECAAYFMEKGVSVV